MAVAIPVVNAPDLYVDGLALSWASNTTLSVALGRARNSTDVNDIILDAGVTINAAANGLNGLDTGSLAASTMYAVYAVGSSLGAVTPGAMVALASQSAPVLPVDCDMYRRIGWALTDSSSHFLLFYQYGSDKTRQYYYDVGISELSGGSSTSFAAIDLATSVPPIATNVVMDILFTPDGATEVAEFLPFGSSASNGIVRFGCGVAAAQQGSITVPCKLDSAVPKVLYKVASGDTLTLLTVGYYDYL